jgi:putative two-component system response regulator
MAYDRPYRPAMGLPTAVDEISKNCGRLYDADAVAACLRVISERRIDFLKGGDRK